MLFATMDQYSDFSRNAMPFSSKFPRSVRLITTGIDKYPLLIKEIKKLTQNQQPETFFRRLSISYKNLKSLGMRRINKKKSQNNYPLVSKDTKRFMQNQQLEMLAAV